MTRRHAFGLQQLLLVEAQLLLGVTPLDDLAGQLDVVAAGSPFLSIN